MSEVMMVTHLVISDNVPLGVSGPVLAEVGVIVIVLDPVLEGEGVGLLVVIMAGLVPRGHVGGHGNRVRDHGGRLG